MKSLIIYFILLFTLAFTLIQAQEKLERLPDHLEIQNYHFSNGVRTESITRMSKYNSSTASFEISSSEILYTARIEGDFTLQHSKLQYFSEEGINKSGTREWEMERTGQGEYSFRFVNKNNREKTRSLDMENGLDYMMTGFLIQSELSEKNSLEPLLLTLFNPTINRLYDLELEIGEIPAGNISAYCNERAFPEEWNELLQSGKSLVIAEGYLTGLARRFYPHPFYYLLDPEENFRILAEWGGDLKDPYYTLHRYL